MYDLQIINLVANLSVAIAGLVLAWAMLKYADKAIHPDPEEPERSLSFSRDIWPELRVGNQAVGTYYGCRILGVLFYLGLVFSRVPL